MIYNWLPEKRALHHSFSLKTFCCWFGGFASRFFCGRPGSFFLNSLSCSFFGWIPVPSSISSEVRIKFFMRYAVVPFSMPSLPGYHWFHLARFYFLMNSFWKSTSQLVKVDSDVFHYVLWWPHWIFLYSVSFPTKSEHRTQHQNRVS